MAAVFPFPPAPPVGLDDLVDQWAHAKRREASANAERVELEQQIIAILGVREDGSQTHTTDAGRKVTITGKLSFKVDLPLLMQLSGSLPEHLRPLKTETVADDKGLRYLRANEPDIWRALAPAVEVKPAKPGVVVKEA
ncbi:MAG: hypothetical protein MUC86_07590 [Burkholderiaceae bacterium]|jgi:hypothetical protein|nr:hypothetical protein [Burkholderiaceae bacterium]